MAMFDNVFYLGRLMFCATGILFVLIVFLCKYFCFYNSRAILALHEITRLNIKRL